jgi:hypothetical protein
LNRFRSLLACLLAALLTSSAAQGELSRQRVLIVVGESAETHTPQLAEALALQARSLGLTARVHTEPAASALSLAETMEHDRILAMREQAFAVVRLDEAAGNGWTLVITDVRTARSVVRQVQVVPPISTALEEASVITGSTLEALLQGGQIGVSSSAVPARTAEPAKQAPTNQARPARVALLLAYQGTSFSPELPWQAGIRGGLAYRLTPTWSVGAAGVWYMDADVASEHADLSLRRYSAEAFLGYRVGGETLQLVAQAALFGEGTSARGIRTGPGYLARDPAVGWTLGGGFHVGPAVRVRQLSFALLLGLDAVTVRPRFVVRSPGLEPVTQAAVLRGRGELRVELPIW